MRKNKTLSFFTQKDLERVELQVYLSSKLKCFPKLSFEIDNNTLVQKTEYITRKKLPDSVETRKKLLDVFMEEIYQMHTHNYIHGDILTKNIVFDGKRLRLIDHELRLYDNNIIKVTYPWVDLEDYETNNITVKTDNICLHATYLKLIDFDSYKIYREKRTQISHKYKNKIFSYRLNVGSKLK